MSTEQESKNLPEDDSGMDCPAAAVSEESPADGANPPKDGFLRALFKRRPFCWRIFQIYFFSFLTTYVVEALSHYKSLPQLMHVFKSPLVFFSNMLIVSIVFIPAILFRKRVFAYIMSTVIWLTVGVVDFIVLHNRVTPFNANDFKMIDDALNVVIHYFTFGQIVLVIFLIVLGLILQ